MSETIVICMPKGSPSSFGDDVEAKCGTCGRDIFHRPHVPEPSSKVCIECFSAAMSHATEPVRAAITEETRREIALLHTRPGGTA